MLSILQYIIDLDDQSIVSANDRTSKKTETKTVVKSEDERPPSAAPIKQLGSKRIMPEKKSDKRASARKKPAPQRGDATTRKAKSSEYDDCDTISSNVISIIQ